MQLQRMKYLALMAATMLAGVIAPLGIFGAIAEDVHEQEGMWFDRAIQIFIHGFSSTLLDTLMYWATTAGSALVLVPINCVVFGRLWQLRRKQDAAFWAYAVVGTAGINFGAKHFFARVRPDLWISRIHETTYSFPSGHAMSTMAAVAALAILLWPTRWRWVALIVGSAFVLAVGISRVYFGVHYPSDVLAGWAASLAWVVGGKLLLGRRRWQSTGKTAS